ncbi:MAG: prenyltransferase, partial [Anaerolineales bacterium]|nr:prenyltransferase [Anaerolineales bacterium]
MKQVGKSNRVKFSMWREALQIIPSVSKEEWNQLDIVSRWLVSTRAAVLIMTFLSAMLAGLFAIRNHTFEFLPWVMLTLGLILAHASNNLLNDYVDFARGVDKDNYSRTMYGPQPLAHGLMTRREHLTFFAFTGISALIAGLYLIAINNSDIGIWILLGFGAFFVLFYTWPLKYIALGEVAVFLVWGPLMIGGGYYVLSHQWDWNIVFASIPYTLGVTTVIFGKHIDKIKIDNSKKIYTLPVLLGEKISRYCVIAMMFSSYIVTAVLILTKFFSPVMLIVVFAIPALRKIMPAFLKPKPEERPKDFPDGRG